MPGRCNPVAMKSRIFQNHPCRNRTRFARIDNIANRHLSGFEMILLWLIDVESISACFFVHLIILKLTLSCADVSGVSGRVLVLADVVQYGPGEFMHFCTMHVIMGLGLGWAAMTL